MKKRRFLLHACILFLAIVCIVCGGYVVYWESQEQWNFNSEERYTSIYRDKVSDLIAFGNAQAQYRENYSDMDRVLVKNAQFGNVTVRDMARMYNDYFNYNNYIGDEDEEEIDYESTAYGLAAHANQMFQENPTEENKKKYNYYNDISRVFDNYRECVEGLIGENSVDENKILNLEELDPFNSGFDSSPTYAPEFCYFITYKLGDKEYTIANFNGEAVSNTKQYKDINIFENGKIVAEDNTYGIKSLNDCLDVNDFNKKATKMVFAINTLYTSDTTHYDEYDHPFLYYINVFQKAPSKQMIEKNRKTGAICGIIAIATVVISIIPFIMLIMISGRRRKDDEPELMAVDNLWLDVVFAAAVTVYAVLACLAIDKLYDEGFVKTFMVCIGLLCLTGTEITVLFSESLARRIKTKKFLETTLIGKVWKLTKRLFGIIRQGILRLLDNVSLTIKIVVFGILAFVGILMCEWMAHALEGVLYLLVIIVFVVGCCYLLWRYFSEHEMIEKGAQKIAGGEIDYKIEDEMKFRANRSLKESINHIGEGLNAAVEESIKNERMKTELITNVSHDLKTPLTSIINYVDLLKTDGLDSERAKKYLDVLAQKSQRLKHLTEDLVEVSKLNSGAVELVRQKLDIVQLVNQSLGEYAEKLEQKNLQIVKTVQEEPLYVLADGRKTWRLFDNLYENIYKYAMPGTRVYVDIRTDKGRAVVSVKNISESPLNFSADELMERFVRGDVSRTTEGSGLGLSIARSIVERQDGEMNITLDGDLFKVEVAMNLI